MMMNTPLFLIMLRPHLRPIDQTLYFAKSESDYVAMMQRVASAAMLYLHKINCTFA